MPVIASHRQIPKQDHLSLTDHKRRLLLRGQSSVHLRKRLSNLGCQQLGILNLEYRVLVVI